MATRTISAAGGNWNSTATWDEAAIPTSADDVVCRADGTSGSTTVTAGITVRSIDLTVGSGYSATMTINSAITLTIGNAVGVKLSAAGTYAGTGILLLSVTQSMTAPGAGVSVPWEIQSSNNVVITLTGTLRSTGRWYYLSGGGTSGAWNGGQVDIINRLWCDGRCAGTTVFRIVGGGASQTLRGNSAASRQLSAPITWDTGANTFTIDTTALHIGGQTLTYASGSAASISVILAGSITLSGSGWSGNLFDVSNSTATYTITFPAVAFDWSSGDITTAHNITFAGATSVSVGTLTASATVTFAHGAIPVTFTSLFRPVTNPGTNMTVTGSGKITIANGADFDLRCNCIFTWPVGAILEIASGGHLVCIGNPSPTMKSPTASSAALLNALSGSVVRCANVIFTDVDASGGDQIKNYAIASGDPVLTRVFNIVNETNLGGGGATETSYGYCG